MNNSKLEYKFRAVNGYDVILSGVKGAQCFNLTIDMRTGFLTLITFNQDLNHLKLRNGKCDEGCVKYIIDFINANIKTSLGFITSGQTIIFEFQIDKEKTSNLKIGKKSIMIHPYFQDIIKSMYDSDIYYKIYEKNIKMYNEYLLTDALGLNGYIGKEQFNNCFDKIVSHVEGKQEGGKKKSRKSKTRKITKKSKVRKMTGGENEEIKETFQRRSTVMGIKPYDLTISTANRKINLEIKITTAMLPLTTLKKSFSDSLILRKNKNNTININKIEALFDRAIKTKFVEIGQTILFEFDLNSHNSKVTIGNDSENIKTDFKDVLFNLFSNNSKKLLEERKNKRTFKSVVNEIEAKKKQTNISKN